jgi:hypothetical protein
MITGTFKAAIEKYKDEVKEIDSFICLSARFGESEVDAADQSEIQSSAGNPTRRKGRTSESEDHDRGTEH